MFVGWEGVGICSYLLVSFWFTRIAANQSSISALLTNRVGDCFLTIGMFAILWSFGNIDYSTVFSLAPYVSENIVTIIGICLLIGAMAKSSQIGLHVWLPMAMEGPTPVSALIHAATMVTAGVYLLMRSSPLIEYSSTVLMLALWIGAFTTVFSSLVGLFQQDIKKVIAYSTMSQLGMMVIAVGLSSYNIALFHLVNHAFYKALLFLGAGSVIHAVADNQDFRKYGGLRPFLPLTYSVMLIASLSLVAFPFMTGFYSKDFILESSYGQFSFFSIAVYFIATLGAMFTTLYSVKVLYITFLSNPNGPQASYKMAHEGDIFMSLPLIILAIFSIFFGYITKDIFIGLGSGFFTDNSLFIHPNHEIMVDTEFAVPTLYKMLPFFFTVSLTIISLIFSEYLYKLVLSFKLSRLGYNLFSFFNQRFYIEMFYNTYITDLMLKLGGQTTKVLDKGSIELIGPFGLEKGLNYLSNTTKILESGNISSYALHILVCLVIYITVPTVLSSHLIIMLLALLNLNLNPRFVKSEFTGHVSIRSWLFSLIILKKNTKAYNILIRAFSVVLVYIMYTFVLSYLANELGMWYIAPFFTITSSFLIALVILLLKNNEFIKTKDILFLAALTFALGIFKLLLVLYLKNSGLSLNPFLKEMDTLFFFSAIYIYFCNLLPNSVEFLHLCERLTPSVLIKAAQSIYSEYNLYVFAMNAGAGSHGPRPYGPHGVGPGCGPLVVVGAALVASDVFTRAEWDSSDRLPSLIRPYTVQFEPRLQNAYTQYRNNYSHNSSMQIVKFREYEVGWGLPFSDTACEGKHYDPHGSLTIRKSLGIALARWKGTITDYDLGPNQKRYLEEICVCHGIKAPSEYSTLKMFARDTPHWQLGFMMSDLDQIRNTAT